MKIGSIRVSQRSVKAGLAAVAGAGLITGAAWSGLAAQPAAAVAAPSAQTARAVGSPVLAGGRDSYADVVSVAAPAVVTIRTEGKARPSPTGLQDEDFL